MENIRIQDDLYTFVNQKKLDELVIPEDKPVMGSAMPMAIFLLIFSFKNMRPSTATNTYPTASIIGPIDNGTYL